MTEDRVASLHIGFMADVDGDIDPNARASGMDVTFVALICTVMPCSDSITFLS
jgi:hypothetical protein